MRRKIYDGPAKKSRPTTEADGPGFGSGDVDPSRFIPKTKDRKHARSLREELALQSALPGVFEGARPKSGSKEI